MRLLTRSIMLSIVALGLAQCQNKSSANPCDELTEVDKKMLEMIDQINEEYKDDHSFLVAFKDAQIYWIQYRNRHLRSVFPLSPKYYDYDVGRCKCEVLRDMTNIRVNELQRWLDGVPDNKECKGSYKLSS